ncbi:ATP-binding protein [Chloroflexota bacterium]
MWQVTGQTRAVSFLRRGLERGMVAHAYLFIGPPHVGKMTLALDLAQALNCEADERPCGVCGSCEKILLAKHADVQVIGLADNGSPDELKNRAEISIDQVREMRHSCNLPPFEGRYKVYIIDGAEKLSIEAANCLLKSLEEPEKRVVFILLTINEKLLPDTVISRCQRLELLPLANNEAEAMLGSIGIVERQKAKLLTRISHGCLGWAIAAASDDNLLIQRGERISELIDIINGDCEERFAYAAKLADQFGQNRERVWQVLDLWLDWWRDLLLVKLDCKDAIANVDFEDDLAEMAKCYRLLQIRDAIDSIQQAGGQLRQNVNPRLALEVLMFDMPKGS